MQLLCTAADKCWNLNASLRYWLVGLGSDLACNGSLFPFSYTTLVRLLVLSFVHYCTDLLLAFVFHIGVRILYLFVGWLTSQQHSSASQGWICEENCTYCHTFHLTESQYTDRGPTSPSTDPTTPGAWQGIDTTVPIFKSLV